MCVWCGVVVVVCVQYVCVKCMCSVRAFVCMHTRVCVSCACDLFFIGLVSCTCVFFPVLYTCIGYCLSVDTYHLSTQGVTDCIINVCD